MGKKNFTGGLNTLLGETPFHPINNQQEQNPPSLIEEFEQHLNKENIKPQSEKPQRKVGRPKLDSTASESRTTFILNNDLLNKFKAIAYWDRLNLKDILVSAMTEYVSKYEKKNGEVKPIPNNAKK